MNLWWKGASDPRNITKRFFAFSQDITMLKKWFTSAFTEIEKISQNLGLKLGQKLWKIESLMKRCIGSAKPHIIDFRFFARYYDADGERISRNWEIISKSGPKARPIIMKNWILMKMCIGPQKPHKKFFHFYARYYDAGEVIHKRISWNWENISKSGPKFGPKFGQKLWKIESLKRRCIGYTKPHRTVLRFFAKYYGAEEVINKRIPWNWENISKSGHKVWPIIMKNWN